MKKIIFGLLNILKTLQNLIGKNDSDTQRKLDFKI